MMKKSNFTIIFCLILNIFFILNCNGIDNSRDIAVIDSEEIIIYSTSIYDGETDVEVNKPFQITFQQKIDSKTIAPQNFYLQNSFGISIISRIIHDNETLTLIPRIPLVPGRTYRIVLKNLRNLKGQLLKPIVISYTNSDLDFGLYWYGKNGLCEKYFPNFENAFYDPMKKTVIYTHGLETGITKEIDPYGRLGFNRESFFYREDNFKSAKQYNGLRKYVNHSWLDDGWNTGIVHWEQFADDINVWGVEAKIWTFDGPSGANYKYLTEEGKLVNKKWDRLLFFKGETIEIKSISHLLGLYVVEALKENISGNLRLVGHSFGNQVACNLIRECLNNDIFIERVALLDPAWTSSGKAYLGDLNGDGKKDWVGERCKKILFDVIEREDKFAVEIYNTSILNLSLPGIDNNIPLRKRVCDVDILSRYYDATQIEAKHVAAVFHYFWSYDSPPPVECTKNLLGVCVESGIGPSASTPTGRIIEMMNEQYRWTQLGGISSPDPVDDSFEKKKK